MKPKNKIGFTLVELLVVVLIIGILAAVAVPMYKRAVLKSQFSTLMPLAKNLWEGNEIFYLNNGEYAASLDELDVSAPADPKVQATLGDEETHQYVRVEKTNLPNRITMYQKNSPNFAGETHCEALQDNERANWLCQDSLQGTFVGNKFGYAVYTLSPEAVGTFARNYYDVTQGSTYEDGDTCTSTQGGGKCSGSFSNGSTCEAYGISSNCVNNQFDNARCIAHSSDSCRGSSTSYSLFKNGSSCTGGNWSCYISTYTDHSYCSVTGNGCFSSNFSGYSYCEGKGSSSCGSNTFTDHSICYAKVNGACENGTYDNTSYCDGTYCPSGAPSPTQGECWDGNGGTGSAYCSAS